MGITLRLPAAAFRLAAISVVLLSAMASFGWADASVRPTAPLHRDHPLVGAIWSAQDGRRVTEAELYDRLADADAVILGEVHDNPDHHALQAEILQAVIDRGRRPTLIFEMIPQDLEGRLDAHLRDRPTDAAGLGPALQWEERGWPDWSMYQPIAEVALANGVAIRAGDLASATKRALGERGIEALGEEERKRLDPGAGLPAKSAASLDEELFQSHCGLVPRQSLAPMKLVQRARDGAMADAIERAGGAGPAVLVAGAGHARRHWGVPASLAARSPDLDVAALAFVEVDPGATEPARYLPESAGPGAAYDYLVFTPAAEREEDPCAALTRRMREKGRGSETPGDGN